MLVVLLAVTLKSQKILKDFGSKKSQKALT
jgi:hypothetical protein